MLSWHLYTSLVSPVPIGGAHNNTCVRSRRFRMEKRGKSTVGDHGRHCEKHVRECECNMVEGEGEGGCVGADCGLKQAHMAVLIPALAATPSLRHLSLGGELPFLVSLRT